MVFLLHFYLTFQVLGFLLVLIATRKFRPKQILLTRPALLHEGMVSVATLTSASDALFSRVASLTHVMPVGEVAPSWNKMLIQLSLTHPVSVLLL